MNRYTFKLYRPVYAIIDIEASDEDSAYDIAVKEADRMMNDEFTRKPRETEVDCVAECPIDPLVADR